MDSLKRRDFLALAAVPVLLQRGTPSPSGAAAGSIFVCMHQASSEKFDFKAAMEGYAKAGIRAVEPNLLKVREFADPTVQGTDPYELAMRVRKTMEPFLV